MNMKYRILFSILFCCSFATAQEHLVERSNTFTLQFGLSFSETLDHRVGAKSFKRLAPKYGLEYTKIRPKSHSVFQAQFYRMKSNSDQDILGLLSIRPVINYAYRRKVKDDFWIGGFYESNTMLNFPIDRLKLYTNNTISYNIAQSFGPSIVYRRNLSGTNNTGAAFFGSVQSSLFSYLIQPAFAHPYPEKYLDESVFSPTRSGMAGPIVRSGKLVSVGRYRSLRIELGVHFFVSNKVKIGINYINDIFYAKAGHKALSYMGHDLMLGVSYVH